MDSVRGYIFSIICTAFLCAIVQILFRQTAYIQVVKMLTGLSLVIAVLNPVLQNRNIPVDYYWEKILLERDVAVHDGEMKAANIRNAHIRDKTESYILSKAKELGADICVEVEVKNDEVSLLQTVTVRGKLSPFTKQRLSTEIENNLGISGEQQIWIS